MANALAPLMYQPANPAEYFAKGQEQGNALRLRQAIEQYGPAAIQGDQNALAALARIDPSASMGLMNEQSQISNRTRATDQNIRDSEERLKLAYESARQETEAHAARMSKAEKEAAIGDIQMITALSGFQTPEEWDAAADQLELDQFIGQFDQRDGLMAMAKGVADALSPPPAQTDDMQEFNFARSQGFGGSFEDWQTKNRPQTNIMGTPPPGYAVQYDEQNRPVSMAPVPGGPAARELEAEAAAAASVAGARENKQTTLTDTIVGAAAKARDLSDKFGTTGLIGQATSGVKRTQAAELRRQVEVLTANATIENLNAMRRESPTGGALGNVTEREGAMLAAAAGALDPDAAPEDFAAQLENYERTLLRIVHGPGKGDEVFGATRPGGNAGSPQPGVTEDGFMFKGGDPGDPNNWVPVGG